MEEFCIKKQSSLVVIYYILALIIWVFGAIFLYIFSFKNKYINSIPARFFLYKNPKFKSSKIHFHACSLGEVVAIKPILEIFDSKAISVITQTGFDEARKISDNTRFLPFEIFLPFWLKKSEILVIFEAEFWLMLVFMAKMRGSKVIVINSRISDRSYHKYKKFRFFYSYFFKFVDRVFAQSEIDKKRLTFLGAKNVIVNGNIKSATLIKPTKIYKKPPERLIILASTHEGEERLLLSQLNLDSNDKLLIAPRHPERFNEVIKFVKDWSKSRGFSFCSFSQSGKIDSKVCVIDTLGELINFYAISDIVVLGGSFVPNVGGHNPIEVATFNNSLITGEYIFNQKALFELVSGVKFIKADELNSLLKSDLQKCRVIKRADLDLILNEIKDSYAKGL